MSKRSNPNGCAFQILADFLDPDNAALTIEGYTPLLCALRCGAQAWA